jgi:hypothetical protein
MTARDFTTSKYRSTNLHTRVSKVDPMQCMLVGLWPVACGAASMMSARTHTLTLAAHAKHKQAPIEHRIARRLGWVMHSDGSGLPILHPFC